MEKEKSKLRKSYLCELRNRANMANKSKVLMIYDKRKRKVGFHIAPGGDTERKKSSCWIHRHALSDGLGVKWGVRDLGLGRNSTMKEMKEIREEETGKRGREKRRPLTESYDLNHNTRRLYRNHFWDPLFHRIIPIQEQRWKLENIWRRKRAI
uniref:Uncharacterized protein n=1 Tax=Solanum demissum TaxID=50514 RepID=Q0KIQ8_SOLDE|nr:hypothetical protein SDM1_32t00014 [Solanum demissum]